MTEVWALTEEYEQVRTELGSPYLILSLHRTLEGAEAAVARWRECHGRGFGHPFKQVRDEVFCECGSAVTLDQLELED